MSAPSYRHSIHTDILHEEARGVQSSFESILLDSRLEGFVSVKILVNEKGRVTCGHGGQRMDIG